MVNDENEVYSCYPWSIFMICSNGKMPPKELRYEGWINDKSTIFDKKKQKEVTPD